MRGEARVERSGLLLDKGSKMKQGLTIDTRGSSLRCMALGVRLLRSVAAPCSLIPQNLLGFSH